MAAGPLKSFILADLFILLGLGHVDLDILQRSPLAIQDELGVQWNSGVLLLHSKA